MAWKLTLLALGAVLLASCFGEGSEVPADGCGEPSGINCPAVLRGPGTFPLSTVRPRVFDVPAGGEVVVRLVSPGGFNVPRRSEFAGLTHLTSWDLREPADISPLDVPASGAWLVIEDVGTGSELFVWHDGAKEEGRTVIRNRTMFLNIDPDFGARLLYSANLEPEENLAVDRRKFDTSARFPTDRSWPLPTAEEALARKPVDALFDAILSSIRRVDP